MYLFRMKGAYYLAEAGARVFVLPLELIVSDISLLLFTLEVVSAWLNGWLCKYRSPRKFAPNSDGMEKPQSCVFVFQRMRKAQSCVFVSQWLGLASLNRSGN